MQCVIDHDDLALLVRAAMAFMSFKRYAQTYSHKRAKGPPMLDAPALLDALGPEGESASALYEALEIAIERGRAVLIA